MRSAVAEVTKAMIAPARPVQAPPEKNRQNSPPRIKQEPPLPAITLGELTPAESDQGKPTQTAPSPHTPRQRDSVERGI